MKFVKYIFLSSILCLAISCNEDEILNEVPLDFLTAENAYVNPEGINSALVRQYNRARNFSHVSSSSSSDGDLWLGTDVAYHARSWGSDRWSVYNIRTDDSKARDRWRNAYRMVFNSNVIIDRLNEDAATPIEYGNADQKNQHLGEAYFFRAWAYRSLVYLFGDVPIITSEVTEAKKDYVRAPKQEVLDLIIADFELARDLLPSKSNISEAGRIPKAAALHYLAETYLANGQTTEAIAATSTIIDDANYGLMTSRFGSRVAEKGDVYWDLFRLNNQNLSENTEGIWVFQDEYLTPGGDSNARWERALGGEYNRFQAKGEANGKRTFIYESTYHGGRAQGYIRPTSHVTHGIWKGNWDNDIRNSNNNILRKWWVDNPESVYYNDTINLADPVDVNKFMGGPRGVQSDTTRYIYPYFLKFTRINNHEADEMTDGSFSSAQLALATEDHKNFVASFNGVGPKLVGGARRYRADTYALRLAETYLLRAEAYLAANNLSSAAEDINVVRRRSGAIEITAADVDMDYILDERLRELIFEEPRRITLGRLGLIYDRTSKYNDYAKDNVQPHHNLYPIPLTDIQANTDAELVQNPGYN